MKIEVRDGPNGKVITVYKRRGKGSLVPIGSHPMPDRGDSVGRQSAVDFLDGARKTRPGEKIQTFSTEV